jgi:membrane-associated protease RseP (regulator of RpoE activity)
VEREQLEPNVRPWLHWLLFTLALITTTFAGAALQGINLVRDPERFTTGLPYSLALMAILGIHEFGHYFTARRNGMQVTPPYFIPVPFAIAGRKPALPVRRCRGRTFGRTRRSYSGSAGRSEILGRHL